jgi:hypothetical protein
MRGNDEKKILGLQSRLGVAGHKTRNGDKNYPILQVVSPPAKTENLFTFDL